MLCHASLSMLSPLLCNVGNDVMLCIFVCSFVYLQYSKINEKVMWNGSYPFWKCDFWKDSFWLYIDQLSHFSILVKKSLCLHFVFFLLHKLTLFNQGQCRTHIILCMYRIITILTFPMFIIVCIHISLPT